MFDNYLSIGKNFNWSMWHEKRTKTEILFGMYKSFIFNKTITLPSFYTLKISNIMDHSILVGSQGAVFENVLIKNLYRNFSTAKKKKLKI